MMPAQEALSGWVQAAAVQRTERSNLEGALPARASHQLVSKTFAAWKLQAREAAACTAALEARCARLLR